MPPPSISIYSLIHTIDPVYVRKLFFCRNKMRVKRCMFIYYIFCSSTQSPFTTAGLYTTCALPVYAPFRKYTTLFSAISLPSPLPLQQWDIEQMSMFNSRLV